MLSKMNNERGKVCFTKSGVAYINPGKVRDPKERRLDNLIKLLDQLHLKSLPINGVKK
jgi:hypothetical protein